MSIPRVTEILRPFTSYDQVPKNILENAAIRGTIVHSYCASIAKGDWIPDSLVDESYLPYVKSFQDWKEAQVSEFPIVEKRYTHSLLNYTGQLDFVVKGNDGELYLVDLKTSSKPQKTYPIQMAAYDMLLKEHGVLVKGAMIVYLKKDGSFPDIDFIEDLNEQKTVFIAALECWNYFNKRKKNARSAST